MREVGKWKVYRKVRGFRKVVFFILVLSVFSRIWVFHFEGGGKKKISPPPEKKIPPESGFSGIFGCIPSFLDKDSVSSEYHGVCVASVRVCEGCLGKKDGGRGSAFDLMKWGGGHQPHALQTRKLESGYQAQWTTCRGWTRKQSDTTSASPTGEQRSEQRSQQRPSSYVLIKYVYFIKT